jgi:hypothetical protein|tara:strand:- start:691 stop:1041 length:351 start_codon:yes stop_codon:yes gene_type:complete
MKKKIFCFDLDNVLCRTIKNNYEESIPLKKNINVVNQLYIEGHYIKIFTARYMGRNKENTFKAKRQAQNITKVQLKKWQVNYNQLIFGKPSFDIYIDDKNIDFKKNWSKILKKKYL